MKKLLALILLVPNIAFGIDPYGLQAYRQFDFVEQNQNLLQKQYMQQLIEGQRLENQAAQKQIDSHRFDFLNQEQPKQPSRAPNCITINTGGILTTHCR